MWTILGCGRTQVKPAAERWIFASRIRRACGQCLLDARTHLRGGTLTERTMDEQARWYAAELPIEGGVIADVGANVGELSEVFWREGGTVLSVEPLRANVRAIEQRITELDAGGRWRVEPCAVSDREGEIDIVPFVSKHLGGKWNCAVADAHTHGTCVRVPCRRLSTLVPDATVVKMDIEGHEYTVLDEALPRLARVQAWALELHMVPERPLEGVLGHFHALGFASFAAGRPPTDPHGPWRASPISHTMTWSAVPIARVRADGSTFKMLHVIARRR
jgi:FkbM family methyltransferase